MGRRLVDHGLMAEMNAVKITDGDRGIPDEFGKARNVSENSHSGGLGSYR